MKSGNVTPLVVFSDKRINTPEFKDVPCTGELGYKGMDALGTWRAFFVKKGTPKPIMDKLTGAFKRVYDSPTYQKYAKDNLLDITPGWLGPEDTAKLVQDCTKIYADVFKQLGRLK
jgi:tripartite-type tricarboxylate transporter receptor subunit TctC